MINFKPLRIIRVPRVSDATGEAIGWHTLTILYGLGIILGLGLGWFLSLPA